MVGQVAHPILFHLEEGAMAQVYPLPWELYRKYEKLALLDPHVTCGLPVELPDTTLIRSAGFVTCV